MLKDNNFSYDSLENMAIIAEQSVIKVREDRNVKAYRIVSEEHTDGSDRREPHLYHLLFRLRSSVFVYQKARCWSIEV